MEILESISMWGGLAGVVIAIFAVVILYLTRSNIVDLLDKDAIMYDKVYELKKNAIQNAFDILDYYEIYGMEVRSTKQFIQKAKNAYNELMCVANTPKVYEDFYTLTLDQNYTQITVQNIADFKVLCRNDLGLRNKKNKHKVENTELVSQIKTTSAPQKSAPGQQRPSQARPVAHRPMPNKPENEEE